MFAGGVGGVSGCGGGDWTVLIVIKIKLHSSCEIEDFIETRLCKLCVILRSRVIRVVCPH